MVRLQQFFEERSCPARTLAAEFIQAADKYHLDWRLLPSISYVETTGGKAQRNNNILGWNSSRTRFSSIRQGIETVASRFATSRLYRGKDAAAKLRTYNPRLAYSQKVLAIMETLGPAEFQLATN